MPIQNLYIFGGKSTALEIAETTALVHPEAAVFQVIGDAETPEADHHFRISELDTRLDSNSGENYFILSMANPDLRRDCLKKAEEIKLQPLTLVHPRAFCAPSATLGEGCYLAPGAVVSTEANLGPHNVINYNATVGHHTRTGEHCIINPGAAVGGNVTLGNRILVGSNAFLFQGTTIGDDCQIDALTYIRENLPAGRVAFGRNTRIFNRPGF